MRRHITIQHHRPLLRTHIAGLLFGLTLLLLAGCGDTGTQPELLSGSSMGTSWSLKYWSESDLPDPEQVRTSVQAALDGVEYAMSTYRADSELSRFNQSQSLDWQPVSIELASVISHANKTWKLTSGAYDITVGPLTELWGFGASGMMDEVPETAAITHALEATGFDKLQVSIDPPRLRKLHPALQVDLSSIAKGFAVDQAAASINHLGIDNYMLEVGGELITAGMSHRRQPWRIAIEKPVPSGERSVQLVINPHGQAVATSGDYRNFFKDSSGQVYSHMIDPRTGYPVSHALASVTVIGSNVMAADALATGLLALGPDAGWALAQREQMAVLFITRVGDKLDTKATPAFQRHYVLGSTD